MKTIPVNIEVSDEIFELLSSGALTLYGMVKDNGNVVRKHLPAIITKANKLSVHDAIALAQLSVTAISAIGTGIKFAHDFYIQHKQQENHIEHNEHNNDEPRPNSTDNIIYFDDILKAQKKAKVATI